MIKTKKKLFVHFKLIVLLNLIPINDLRNQHSHIVHMPVSYRQHCFWKRFLSNVRLAKTESNIYSYNFSPIDENVLRLDMILSILYVYRSVYIRWYSIKTIFVVHAISLIIIVNI